MTEEAPARPKIPMPRPPEWLDAHLAEPRRQQSYSPLIDFPKCRSCTHIEHGLPCTALGGACTCESSYATRDDSWRPVGTFRVECDAEAAMHVFGCDGWVAKAIIGLAPVAGRLRRLMHGGGRDA